MSVGDAKSYASNANTSAGDAKIYASNASTSATNAQAYADAAAQSKTDVIGLVSTAQTYATNASNNAIAVNNTFQSVKDYVWAAYNAANAAAACEKNVVSYTTDASY